MKPYNTPLKGILVRDKVPDLRRQQGWISTVRNLASEGTSLEKSKALEAKLREEIREFKDAKERHRDEEMVDIWEVLCAIEKHNISVGTIYAKAKEMLYFYRQDRQSLLNRLRERKLEEKGGFEHLAYIVEEHRAQ